MDNSLSQSADDSLLAQTRKLLRRYNIRPKKGLGQNFLIDDRVLDTILDAAELNSEDTVIEVGPGLGLMTRELARRAGWVIAIELDNRLADILKETLESENIVVLNENVLGTDPAQILRGSLPHIPANLKSYKVVANLPYYITSPVLRHFLEAPVKPELMVVMVQKEVAEAICAPAGQRSVLSIGVQFYGRPGIVAGVPAAAFFPAPEVDSAVVRVNVYPTPPVHVDDEAAFFKLVRAGFAAARKQAANALAQGLGIDKAEAQAMLERAGIDSRRRAETFTLDEWGRLYGVWGKK